MRVAAVVVKQRTILPTIMNDTDGANLNTSRAHVWRHGLPVTTASTPGRTASAVKIMLSLILSVPAVVHGIFSHRTHLEGVAIPRPQIDVKSGIASATNRQ
jgi:hypothetical protein